MIDYSLHITSILILNLKKTLSSHIYIYIYIANDYSLHTTSILIDLKPEKNTEQPNLHNKMIIKWREDRYKPQDRHHIYWRQQVTNHDEFIVAV